MGALQIDLLGTSFALKADEDDEYLEKLLSYYERFTSQIRQSGTLTNPLQISILAGLMISDELFRTKNGEDSAKTDFQSLNEKVEKLTLDMIQKIDSVL
ncbi:MAG: cell division protein ZapA [Treponema sp.]|nr:cell division protein ZapA [Treponema sp.]